MVTSQVSDEVAFVSKFLVALDLFVLVPIRSHLGPEAKKLKALPYLLLRRIQPDLAPP